MNTQHQKEMNIKGNVYVSGHFEMTPTRNVSKKRKTLDRYVRIPYFIMLRLFLRELDLTVPGVSKLRQQFKTIKAHHIVIYALLFRFQLLFK
jgi:hypothetical protein